MNFVDTSAYKEIRFEQNKTFILDKILNPQLYISIYGPH